MDANSQDSNPQFRERAASKSSTGSISSDDTRQTREYSAAEIAEIARMAARPVDRAVARGADRVFQTGDFVGRYRINEVLGRGSMGVVYLAHDGQLNRQVALKVPKFNAAGGISAERLLREARAAATLSHPNICPVYEVGNHEGVHYIALAFVTGRPLSTYVKSGKPQPEREAAKVVRKVALALHEAHSQAILHRDLKPANIMIDKRGEPIVMDFGLAYCFEDNTQTRLTQEGTVVGTPAYMSPEQIEGKPLGPKSDVYSLGVVLYELLTGRCPFEGSVISVINQVLHQGPTPITELQPGLSPAIVKICSKAMAKDPADRFESMMEFAKALTAFLNAASDAKELNRLVLATPSEQLATHSRARRRWLIVGAAAGAVLVLTIAGLLIAGAFQKAETSAPAIAGAATSTDVGSEPRREFDGNLKTSGDWPSIEEKEKVKGPPPKRGEFGPRGHHRGHRPGFDRPGPPDGEPPDFDRPQPIDPHRLESLTVEEQFRLADRNEDGKLDGSELPLHLIHRADTNHDDELTSEELKQGIERFGREFYGPPSDDERRDLPDHGPHPGPGPPGPPE